MQIVLIGIKHCGKSTLGRLLARHFDCEFLDSDAELEKNYFKQSGSRCSCREIFKLLGEEKFRKLEAEVIRSLISAAPKVIALGGGAAANPFLDAETLRKLGHIVWLDTADKIAYKRVIRKGLPPFLADAEDPEKRFCEINSKRREQFFRIADTVFKTEVEQDISIVFRQLSGILERIKE